MTCDMASIERGKDAFRRKLAMRPLEEKLVLLDILRERTVTIHASTPLNASPCVEPLAAAQAALETAASEQRDK